MTEIGLGIFDDQESLKKSLEIFEKNKKAVQDHILDRTAIVPEKELKDIIKQFNVSEELAKAIFILEFEYRIPRALSASFYNFELQRLINMQYELPDIYSFRVRFSMEEGFWIKCLVVDLPQKLILKMKKLVTLDKSIFGDSLGEQEDSASYILERAFIISEIIRPVLFSWMKDHQRANYLTAAVYFICSIKRKIIDDSENLINEVNERFSSNIEALETIIKQVRPQGWVLKAKEEFEKIQLLLEKSKNSLKDLDWRIAAELILEAIFLIEYDTIEPEKSTDHKNRLTTPRNIVSEVISSKKEDFVTDKISMTLTKIESLTVEKSTPFIKQLIAELFHSNVNIQHEKPAQFAREFIERISEELYIPQNKITLFLKKFDSQLMYRTSPLGSKDYPNIGIDEKVQNLIEEITLEILSKKDELADKEIIKKKKEKLEKDLPQQKAENSDMNITVTSMSIKDNIISSSDKDLWILIRDEYLKSLFETIDEIDAAGKVLKKLSLELGLLLSQGEASTMLTEELKKSNIIIAESNKEETDSSLCKIIYKYIKDLKSSL